MEFKDYISNLRNILVLQGLMMFPLHTLDY